MLFILLVFILSFFITCQTASPKVGNFQIVPLSVKSCLNNTTKNPLKLYLALKENKYVIGNLTAEKDTGPITALLVAYRYSKNSYVKMFTHEMKPLCKHLLIKLLPKHLNFDNKCVLKQGVYPAEPEIDVCKITKSLIGHTFVYGKFLFRLEWFVKKKLFLCVESISESVKI